MESTDPPGPIPDEPTATYSGNNYISLHWNKPYPADAAPVTSYRIEAWLTGVDGGARWIELGTSPINSFDALNLKQGGLYHFRVTPRNRYGWGPSVQTETPVAAGNKEKLPEFTAGLPGQLKVLVDTDYALECVVEGHPPPNIRWFKNDTELRQSSKLSITFNSSICRLVLRNIDFEDTGKYVCEASNSNGRASTFARLQVVGDKKIFDAHHNLKQSIDKNIVSLAETLLRRIRVNYRNVFFQESDCLPQFVTRLRDRRVQATYPIQLTCQTVGWPTPELLWYKNGHEIQNGGNASNSTMKSPI